MNKKEAYFILISTFVSILAWIIFSILQSAVNSTISAPLSVQISPIHPTFDTQTISALKKRTLVLPAEEVQPDIATSTAQQTTGTNSAIQIP